MKQKLQDIDELSKENKKLKKDKSELFETNRVLKKSLNDKEKEILKLKLDTSHIRSRPPLKDVNSKLSKLPDVEKKKNTSPHAFKVYDKPTTASLARKVNKQPNK